ncbi:MAG: hypothetical protein IPO85_18630 [Saprospiraceae bacterium]|uniref:Uncharacterized protein n=1 Tax=Candidatus Defluviibacterium haderslevense TaxID=2981993 RepID=A0A9D7SBB1_9BACT|nr:hypothetical protein [Candidatus Defluviibacterium haderslevense]
MKLLCQETLPIIIKASPGYHFVPWLKSLSMNLYILALHLVPKFPDDS